MKDIQKKQIFMIGLAAALAFAQPAAYPPPGPSPSYPPGQLDDLVSRIALYPDPLLSQALAAATYPGEIQ